MFPARQNIRPRIVWTLAFIAALLVLVNGAIFFSLSTSQKLLDQELGKRLQGTAHIAALLVAPEQFEMLSLASADTSAAADTALTDFSMKMDSQEAADAVRTEWTRLAQSAGLSNVVLVEELDWLGGQLTSQAVPPDEHPWIEIFGATRSYREFRSQIRDYYYRNYPLTPQAGSRRALNPGNGSVSKLCHEPRVALAVLEQLLAPYVSGHQLIVLRRHKAISADTHSDSVKAVTVRSLGSGDSLTLSGQFFIDATEMGDLLPLTRTEYVTGFESRRQTQEPHAPPEAQPALERIANTRRLAGRTIGSYRIHGASQFSRT
jgi:hypothetical protein